MLNDKMKGITKMKKVRFLVGAIALAVLAAIIVACTKEKEKKAARNSSEMVTVSKEDDMSAYLKQFKEKMQSESKGGETLSLEDARWHLEALLNYTYGDAGYQTTEIQCDTLYYRLPSEGDKVSLIHLNEAFNSLSVDVEKSFGVSELPDKSILAIQAKICDESKDGDVIVRVIPVFRGFTPVKFWFDSTDYWSEYYNEDDHYGSGKCGPFSGQCINSGAPHELTKLANLRIPAYGCADGYRKYVTDCEVYPFHGGDDEFLMDDDSPCGYKIYINPLDPDDPYHNPSHCIPPEDMNYYLSKFLEIEEHYKPSGKVIIEARYYYDVLTSIPGSIEFGLELLYAVVYCEPTGQGADQ